MILYTTCNKLSVTLVEMACAMATRMLCNGAQVDFVGSSLSTSDFSWFHRGLFQTYRSYCATLWLSLERRDG